jgi:hypothetical protein
MEYEATEDDNVEYLNPGDIVISKYTYKYFQDLIKFKEEVIDKIKIEKQKSKDFECCIELCDELLEFIEKRR